MRLRNITFLLGVLGLLASGTLLSAASAVVDYSRDILPILSDKCYHCHGPDEKARKAKLRLDLKEGAFQVKDGMAIIAPGDPKKSELIRRISTSDQDDLMPPPKSNRKLTPAQVQLLTRWVEQGAKWGMHWAFVPPASQTPPQVKNTKWVKNGIDRFVLGRLEKEGLRPAPPASREALMRRVTLDLTGLPATTAEVDAFLADRSPNAYEKVVDR